MSQKCQASNVVVLYSVKRSNSCFTPFPTTTTKLLFRPLNKRKISKTIKMFQSPIVLCILHSQLCWVFVLPKAAYPTDLHSLNITCSNTGGKKWLEILIMWNNDFQFLSESQDWLGPILVCYFLGGKCLLEDVVTIPQFICHQRACQLAEVLFT